MSNTLKKHLTIIFMYYGVYTTGIETDILLQLDVQQLTYISNSTKIKLQCFSRPDPYEFHAEILIDNKTIDSITYDTTSAKCYHKRRECKPEVCTCSHNRFTRLLVVDLSKSKLFSCKMVFADANNETTFLKTAAKYFEGKEFYTVVPGTEIIKDGNLIYKTQSTPMTSTKSSFDKTTKYGAITVQEGIIIGISCILMIALTTVIIYFWRKENTYIQYERETRQSNRNVTCKPDHVTKEMISCSEDDSDTETCKSKGHNESGRVYTYDVVVDNGKLKII